MKSKISLTLLALSVLCLPSCITTTDPNDKLTPLYNGQGEQVANVSEKNLASVRGGDNVPLVKLVKDGWNVVGEKVLETGAVIGKGIVSSYVDRYLFKYSERVTPSK